MDTSRRIFIMQATALALTSPALTWASTSRYPNKAVRFHIPYAPGAATDTLGRLAAEVYSKTLGQPFVVENKGGAGSVIGTNLLAASAPDGYAIGMVDSAFTINPGLRGKDLPYDTFKDFAPISLMATAPFVMVVHPSVPATDIASFLALAKEKPGELAYGSAGVGSAPHLAGAQLQQQANINIQHIPYRGGGTVFTDLLGGQFEFAFGTVPTLNPHIKDGRLRAIAVTSAQRVQSLPDVPTFAEAGLPGVDTSPIFGIVAPAGVPADIIAQLSSTLAQSVQHGALHQKLTDRGFTPIGSTPEQFEQRIHEEVAKWTELIQKGGFKAE
ncbi:tripartite tricarboxylate transporter substrate binding protein [Alcaligenaceae bacterium]|nr:tripartite tricarboxylate transporter substrate binding protein [Alcaligenaceae bacterium]